MVSPTPRTAVLYRGGARGKVVQEARQSQQREQKRRKDLGYDECPNCGKFFKDLSQVHYADFKNKIRCFNANPQRRLI